MHLFFRLANIQIHLQANEARAEERRLEGDTAPVDDAVGREGGDRRRAGGTTVRRRDTHCVLEMVRFAHEEQPYWCGATAPYGGHARRRCTSRS